VILGCRALGVRLTRRQRDDVMHLFRYVGWLLGVDTDFLTDDEGRRHRINYHVLVAAGGQTQAGRDLARATVDAQTQRAYGHSVPWLERGHQRYGHARTLSLLTAFLGRQGMRDLNLPVRFPWAAAAALAANTVRYRVLGRLPGGRRRLEAWGEARQDRAVASSFRGAPPEIGPLPGT
jgi:hypothetical protein